MTAPGLAIDYAAEKAASAARRAARLAPAYAALADWEASTIARRPQNAQQRRGETPPPCSRCGGKHLAKGLCGKCYWHDYHLAHPRKTWTPHPPCACGGAFYARGLCEHCYYRAYNARRRADYRPRRRHLVRAARPQRQQRAA
jgi:hypothetical protein